MFIFNLFRNSKFVGYYKTNDLNKVYDDLIKRYGDDTFFCEFDLEVVNGVSVGDDPILWSLENGN